MANKSITQKQWENGEGYNRYITQELASFRKQAWQDMLCGHFEADSTLDILDVGTGPGFFACILSQQGHRVTGIDNSEGMLACARQNAQNLEVSPQFLAMDVNHLQFADEAFDVIVTRNVTWTLEHPQEVYTEFKRILRPGGKLLIYDANWHLHYYNDDLMARVRKREQAHFKTYGTHEVVCNDNREYYDALPLSNTIRPQWDVDVLGRLGFAVSVKEDIGQLLYTQWEKDLYGESPLFEVCAVKAEMPTQKIRIHNYWQKRSATFGFSLVDDSVEAWQEKMRKYLPQGSLKVLDIGTGPGFLAAAAAMMGHEVTGIDLCSNMIEKAKANAEASGLSIRFLCTDAGELPFEDETFDVVMSRNLVWALLNPEEVLQQWQRVLKPGGLLLYFDGNHYYYLFSDEDCKNREAYVALTGSAHKEAAGTVDYSEMDNAALLLPLSKLDRPHQWDAQVLPKLGYEVVAIEEDRPQDRLAEGIADGYYTAFQVVARKPAKTGGKQA